MKSCPLCSSSQITIKDTFENYKEKALKDHRRQHIKLIEGDTSLQFNSFLECKDCSLIFLDTLPPSEAISHFYEAYYGSSHYGTKREKKVRRATKNIKTLMPKIKGKRFLDVGCNLGYAVEAALSLGLESAGYDLDSTAVQQASIHYPTAKFYSGLLKDVPGIYDLIYCTEVIEHVKSPHDFIVSLANLLAPGGLLFLTTPDAGHFLRPRLFSQWKEVKPPEHLYYFSKKNLSFLLTQYGFSKPTFLFNFKTGLKVVAKKYH